MSDNKKPNSTEKKTLIRRLRLFEELTEKWKNTATSIFVWKGLPSEFLSDEIERILYRDGRVVLFKDDKDGVIRALPMAPRYGLNEYGYPVNWGVFGLNGYHKDNLNETNSVLIWNNKTMKATDDYVYLMVERLVNTELTIDMQLNAMKLPFLFRGNKDQLLTFKNVYKKITDSEPVLYLDKAIFNGQAEFEVYQTNTPNYLDSLTKLYNDYEGRILNHLGLKYVPNEKKERLVVDEVNKNTEHTETNFGSMFKARKDAAKKASEILGITITCDISEHLMEAETEQEDKKEDKKDE